MSEVIRSELLARAPRILDELVEAFEREGDPRVKRLLLQVIADRARYKVCATEPDRLAL